MNIEMDLMKFTDILDSETEFIPLLSTEDEEIMNAEEIPEILPILLLPLILNLILHLRLVMISIQLEMIFVYSMRISQMISPRLKEN